ncbi:Isochorismatase family protein [uncultured archaeon]|nr:Isochorismatase family protein [uncultured archaeon]
MRPQKDAGILQNPTFKDLGPLTSLVSASKELQVPTFFFYFNHGNIVPQNLLDAAGQNGKTIQKYDFDAFSGTGIDGMLKSANISTLILAGFDADICVKHTAQTAKQRATLS